MLSIFWIVIVIWVSQASQRPPYSPPLPTQNVTLPITPQSFDESPSCYNLHSCNNTLQRFYVVQAGHPFNLNISSHLNEDSWVISRATLTIKGDYCFSLPHPTFVNFQVKVNENTFDTFVMNTTKTCATHSVYSMGLDTGSWWWFYYYSYPYQNQISLSVLTDDFFFLLTEGLFLIEYTLLDPDLSNYYPYYIVNPWSLYSPFNFQVWVTYIDVNHDYVCILDKPELNLTAIGNLTGVHLLPGYDSWQGWCQFPQTKINYTMELGVFIEADLIIRPAFHIPMDLIFDPNTCLLYEQPIINYIQPTSGYANTLVSLYGNGFFGPRIFIQDKFGPTSQYFRSEMYNLNLIQFIVPEQLDPKGELVLCISVSINDEDFVPTTCDKRNSFTYLGLPPNHTIIPAPQIQPSDSPWMKWLIQDGWIMILIGGVVFFVMFFVLGIYCYQRKKYEDDEQQPLIKNSPEDEIDSKVLISINDLVIRETIGSGSFAAVYRGYWRKTEVAIKMLHNNPKNDKLSFLKESSLMLTLRHPNVVSLMGIVLNPRLCIITEYCIRGDVASVMLDPKCIVEPEHIRKISLDTCRGMNYLHETHVIHRDLKCCNLLIDKDWNIKVADFGMARAYNLEQNGTMTSCGTPSHAAPEVIKRVQYSTKADVYSFGICLWEMCVRKEPYAGIPGFQVIVAVATKRMRPRIPVDLDPLWASLIRRCWMEDPEFRPEFSVLVEFFEEMRLPLPMKKMPYKVDQTGKVLSSSSSTVPQNGQTDSNIESTSSPPSDNVSLNSSDSHHSQEIPPSFSPSKPKPGSPLLQKGTVEKKKRRSLLLPSSRNPFVRTLKSRSLKVPPKDFSIQGGGKEEKEEGEF